MQKNTDMPIYRKRSSQLKPLSKEEAQKLEVLDKDFKPAILNMCQTQKEIKYKELNKCIRIISKQIENTNL